MIFPCFVNKGYFFCIPTFFPSWTYHGNMLKLGHSFLIYNKLCLCKQRLSIKILRKITKQFFLMKIFTFSWNSIHARFSFFAVERHNTLDTLNCNTLHLHQKYFHKYSHSISNARFNLIIKKRFCNIQWWLEKGLNMRIPFVVL